MLVLGWMDRQWEPRKGRMTQDRAKQNTQKIGVTCSKRGIWEIHFAVAF